MCLLTWKSNKVVTTGEHAFTPAGSLPSVHGGRGQQKLVTDWGALSLVQVPPSAHRGRGWLVGTEFTMAVPPLLHHSTVISCFQGRPRFLQEHFWLQSSSHLSPQVVPEQLSSSFPFLFLQECLFRNVGCLYTANSSHFPGSSLLSPHFSTQPLLALVDTCLELGHPGLWHRAPM